MLRSKVRTAISPYHGLKTRCAINSFQVRNAFTPKTISTDGSSSLLIQINRFVLNNKSEARCFSIFTRERKSNIINGIVYPNSSIDRTQGFHTSCINQRHLQSKTFQKNVHSLLDMNSILSSHSRSSSIIDLNTRCKRQYTSATSPFGGGSGGPMKNFNDRLYNAIAEYAYQYPSFHFIPYVEGDREGTLALFYLILAQIVIYIVVTMIYPRLAKHFVISRQAIAERRYHVILTHALHHTSILHLLINSYVLISFAKNLIGIKGLQPVALIYLTGCALGGILTAASMTTSSNVVYNHHAMGSSTGIFALFTYMSLKYPSVPVGIVFLPFQTKAIHLWYAAVGFEAMRILLFQSPTAAGHLGGALGGALTTLTKL